MCPENEHFAMKSLCGAVLVERTEIGHFSKNLYEIVIWCGFGRVYRNWTLQHDSVISLCWLNLSNLDSFA